jgi:hypothetical protein
MLSFCRGVLAKVVGEYARGDLVAWEPVWECYKAWVSSGI